MRTLLSTSVAAALFIPALAGDGKWLSPEYKWIYQFPLPIPEDKELTYTYENKTSGKKIDFYEVTVKPFTQEVYPGLKPAQLVGYDGVSPGKTFRMTKGREAVVRFKNEAPMDISVHLHGSYSRTPFDGWAEDVTKKGQYKDYYYPNSQSARTLWYHDHAIHHTAENAYFGQAGFYILHDPAEDALGLPKGKYDIPLALNAKQYNADGTLFNPKDETTSLWGDVIHVNGQPWPYHPVEPRKYRLRFLDASISRAFKLTFVDDAGKEIPFQVIGADTGLLTKPVTSTNLEISMAERWEVLFDFAAYAGQNVTVKNARDVQHDEDYNSTNEVMRFVVGNDVSDTKNNDKISGTLRNVPFPPKTHTAVDRKFEFHRSNGEWQVNGVTFADVKNRILAKPPRGAIEIWELKNGAGGWSHPVHIHLIDFQILSRTGGKRPVLDYEKEALKDVVLLGENEVVTVIARYAPYDGVYMFHCHNLIHEDHDMMAAFNVTALQDFGYPETTRFIDPMEDRWRAKDYTPDVDTYEAREKKCALFESLYAYDNVTALEAAIDDYYKNGPSSRAPSTLQTMVSSTPAVTPAPSGAKSAGASVITPAPTSTKKNDDDAAKKSSKKAEDDAKKASKEAEDAAKKSAKDTKTKRAY